MCPNMQTENCKLSTAPLVQDDLGLYGWLRPICPNTLMFIVKLISLKATMNFDNSALY